MIARGLRSGRVIRALAVPCAIAMVTMAARAAEKVYEQWMGGGYSYESFTNAWGENQQAADDFYVEGEIERIVFKPGFSDAPLASVSVYVYAVAPDGSPGTLQAEYTLAAGDPDLVVSASAWDVTLRPPFSATGRHYVSLVPHIDDWHHWSWRSANDSAPRYETVFTRTDGGPWSHPDPTQPPWNPGQEDLNFAMYGTVTAPGSIEQIDPPVAMRSEMIRIRGRNFAEGGTVMVGGAPAIVAEWTDGLIRAYVPETAPVGSPAVTVTTAGGTSPPATLEVALRQPSGRMRWRVELPGPWSQVRPAIGPDGTVYAIDTFRNLAAVSSDGALEWLRAGVGDKGVTVGADGKIYTGSENDVRAFFPDGTLDWVFVQDPRAFILVGLSVGPDGNLYGVASSGMGVFSLTPQGSLRWQVEELYRRPIVSYGEIVFGDNQGRGQLYFYANSHLRALETRDGSEVFLLGYRQQPAVAPDQSVHVADTSLDPDGNVVWYFPLPIPNNSVTAPDVGPDGVHYMIQNLNDVYALDPDGSERWMVDHAGECFKAPNVSPANDVLLTGTCSTLDQSQHVVALRTSDGGEAWRQPLGQADGYRVFPDSRGRFTADGQTAYVMTAIATGDNFTSRAWVHAIDTSAGGSCAPPSEVTGVGVAADGVRVYWNAGATGSLYDLARGEVADLAAGIPATCLATDLPVTFHDDPAAPAVGAGYYYVVRARDGCGAGSFGQDSSGAPRATACP